MGSTEVSDSDGADGQWYEGGGARRTSRGEGTKKEAVATTSWR